MTGRREVGVEEVSGDDWLTALADARGRGARLDWIAGVDQGDRLALVAHVFTATESVLVRATFPWQASLPCVRSVFPSADWHQREIAEMFGLGFDSGPSAPLLLRGDATSGGNTAPGAAPPTATAPMRRDFALRARVDRPWPGASESSGRRRSRTPGVRPEWRNDR